MALIITSDPCPISEVVQLRFAVCGLRSALSPQSSVLSSGQLSVVSLLSPSSCLLPPCKPSLFCLD